jgi:uncharacterized membrane protein
VHLVDQPQVSTPPRSSRLAYLDWLRGITVLVMIEAHTFDSWTLASERARPMFGRLMVLGGMAAPLFLFLAGVAAALAASAEIDRGRSAGDAARRVERRGWQLFLLAFVFRLQSFVLGGFSRPATLLKVDILNVMGPAIACTAALWGSVSTRRGRAIVLTTATLLLLGISPWIRTTPLLAALPDPIEWYIRPPGGQGTFTIFPWAGFVLAGGVLGVALDGARSAGWSTWRLQASIAAAGLALGLAGDWAGRQPILFPGATFWGTSPAYFAIRTGLILLLVFAAWAWSERPWRRVVSASPLVTLGVGSLFVYWVHVELVYGFASRPLRHRLTLEQCAVAWAGFSLAMYALLLSWNASRPTRLWLREEAAKLFKSGSWTPTPLANR